MEKANGIKYLYASVVRHPDVRAVVGNSRGSDLLCVSTAIVPLPRSIIF